MKKTENCNQKLSDQEEVTAEPHFPAGVSASAVSLST